MDGSYIKDGQTFYYNTENPSATKFTITIPVDADGKNADETLAEDGTQISYIINYTAGEIMFDTESSPNGYEFEFSGITPDLVGYDPSSWILFLNLSLNLI